FHPCGFSGSVMTSLSREVGRPVPIAEVTPHIVDAWREVFYAPPDRSAAVGAPTGVSMTEGPPRPRLLLVGGGTGLVGRHIVAEFGRDWHIVSLHRHPSP